MEIETMTEKELPSIKGGQWAWLNNTWHWGEETR